MENTSIIKLVFYCKPMMRRAVLFQKTGYAAFAPFSPATASVADMASGRPIG
jgi:hypothetical protein